jgi:hypothetical protein
MKSALEKRGYRIIKTLKKTETDGVFLAQIVQTKTKVVIKTKLNSSTSDSQDIDLTSKTLETEKQAMKVLPKLAPFFVRSLDYFRFASGGHALVMEWIEGPTLIELSDEFWSEAKARDLICQLALASKVLEDRRVLHNDFWDANIILQPVSSKGLTIKAHTREGLLTHKARHGFLVRVIDYQYTHQYTRSPQIHSPFVASKNVSLQAEKARLGWSRAFHRGGDLNQILGLLSDYPNLAPSIKSLLKKMVVRNTELELEPDFPYAIVESNLATAPDSVLKLFC